MHLAAAVFERIPRMRESLATRLASVTSLEAAAHAWIETVHAPLAHALVLARAFAILPYATLPPFEAEHAARVAGAAGQTLDAKSPVLALLASCGARPEWNERRRSLVHLALPLASSAIVESSPMVARLLDDLGVRLTSVGWGPRIIASAREVPEHPTFYVADAVTTLDARGRFVIPARDFVAEHEVKTVFGIGGSLGGGSVFAMILFARQHVTRAVAEQLVPLAADFRAAAVTLGVRGALFEAARADDS